MLRWSVALSIGVAVEYCCGGVCVVVLWWSVVIAIGVGVAECCCGGVCVVVLWWSVVISICVVVECCWWWSVRCDVMLECCVINK